MPTFIVRNKPLHKVDKRLFGEFLERAGQDEPGPERALIPATHQLQPAVEDLVTQMRLPIIRFPGGSMTEWGTYDWDALIDHAPAYPHGRPDGCDFGVDEFLRYSEKWGNESILVVRFRDAVERNLPLEVAALHAAGLVAYCNTTVGAVLPSGMPDWPAQRARNGRPAPYGVGYFAIGNEIWSYVNRELEKKLGMTRQELIEWLITCHIAFIDLMRQIDPGIRIIIDGQIDWDCTVRDGVLADPRIKTRVDYIDHHEYQTWEINRVSKNGEEVPACSLTEEEVWNAWVSTPGSDSSTGEAVILHETLDVAKKLGYKVAATEWNWNGWNQSSSEFLLNSGYAKGVGAAAWLNAFIRAGDLIEIATQSGLMGCKWDIGAIRYDPDGVKPPCYSPTGQAVMFYAHHHGHTRLEVTTVDLPVYPQPYTMGAIKAYEKVAVLDAVATIDEDTLFFHVINRSFTTDHPITIDLTDFPGLTGKVIQHLMTGQIKAPGPGEREEMISIRQKPVSYGGGVISLTLPMRSVSIIEIPVGRED